MKIKHVVFMLAFLIVPSMAAAETSDGYFSIFGGYHVPEVDDWDQHYDDDGFWTGGIERGMKLTKRFELGFSASYAKEEGSSTTLSGRPSADETTYEQVPVNVSLSYRLLFTDNQVIVPFIGGGYTHIFYREEISGKDISGDLNGYHARGGIHLLLDYFDPESANDFDTDWDIGDTYLIIEAVYSKVDDFGNEDVDLGGMGYFTGLRFDF